MKKLWFFIIFLFSSHGNSQVDEVFTVIFASRKNIYVAKSDNLIKAKILKQFERDVTSLAVYENYLFVSLKRSHWYSRNSAVWRANITNIKNFEVDPKSWDEFHVINNFFDDITCMTIAKEHIYAGLSDGKIERCLTEEKNRCERFQKLDGHFRRPPYFYKAANIIGIDYNPGDGKIYVVTDRLLYSCLPQTVNSCQWIRLHHRIEQISALKVAFDAIWLGVKYGLTQKETLMECPTWKATTGFGNQNDCQRFAEYSKGKLINTIDAAKGYLYYKLEDDEKIYRCNPKDNSSCFSPVPKLVGSIDTFIIV